MFYGSGRTGAGAGGGGGDFKGSPKNRHDRYEQMGKQQELIEQKKREIEAKLQAERHKKAMEALLAPAAAVGPVNSSAALSATPSTANKRSLLVSKKLINDLNLTSNLGESTEEKPTPIKANVFANDGSFFEQFKKLQEQQKKKEFETKIKAEPLDKDEYGSNISGNRIRLLSPNPKPPLLNEGYFNKSGAGIPPPHFYNEPVSHSPPPPPPPRHQPQHHHPSEFRHENYDYPPPPPPPPPPRRSPSPSRRSQYPPGFPSMAVKNLAASVAERGDQVEEMARVTNKDSLLWFLYRPDSAEYRKYRELVLSLRQERRASDQTQGFGDQGRMSEPSSHTHPAEKRLESSVSSSGDEDEDKYSSAQKRKRSRWGPQSELEPLPPPAIVQPLTAPVAHIKINTFAHGLPPPPPPPPPMGFPPGAIKVEAGATPAKDPMFGNNIPGISAGDFKIRGPPPLITKITNPQLLAYAKQSYGTVDLDDEQWKQCEEAYKMNLLFQDIARKRARDEHLASQGKFKHEYDSDEDVDNDGTWEHKQRLKEMEKTKEWANDLTHKAKGKHHIGDFLPPEELTKFMDKYKAVKEGRQMDESAYQDFKIAQDNVGFKLLQKMGWSQGQGLGAESQGIVEPIKDGNQGSDKTGLGVEKPSELNEDDDEFAAYRKRMMLAYRFRPNPLNNPRRAYY